MKQKTEKEIKKPGKNLTPLIETASASYGGLKELNKQLTTSHNLALLTAILHEKYATKGTVHFIIPELIRDPYLRYTPMNNPSYLYQLFKRIESYGFLTQTTATKSRHKTWQLNEPKQFFSKTRLEIIYKTLGGA